MRTLFFLISIFTTTILYAGIDIQSDSLYGSSLAAGSGPIDVKGSRYNQLLVQAQNPGTNPSFWVKDAFGLVKLSYPAYSSASGYPTGTATVGVSISYEKFENGAFISKTTNTTLSLNFQPGSFANATYLKLPHAHHLTVKVTSVNIPSGLLLSLNASVETNSFDLLAQSLPSSFAIQATPTATDSSLMVSWTSVKGAQSYDLEWTYVSDQDSSLLNTSNNTKPYYYNRLDPSFIKVDPYLFRYNSTRVNVDTLSLSYKIPLIYEQGIVVYRVRAVGQSIANNTPISVTSGWTAPDGNNNYVGDYAPNYFKYSGHEPSMNWQYSLSLAEQGKNKAVLSYYDGSSRNRQAVTRINSDQRVIIGETFYDYNGRPTIQLLPVPVTANQLLYYPNFNLITGESQLNKSDYDASQQGNGCASIAPSFVTTTGASQYYSSANAFDTLGNKGSHLLNRNLIPDAQQYPYTQTLYTPDNTGRIAAQSGVGITHKLGSNKETRYLYGSPQQPELSRLFGNQVGYASHYKKNAVIDANGQTSVSYLNMEGKVVATALAGDNPSNLDTLGDNAARKVSSDLIASSGGISNLLSPDGLSKTFNSKFLVTGPTNYTFNYKGTVGSYNVTCSTSTSPTVLYPIDGAVDVQLTLNDHCGNNVFNELQSSQAGNTGNSQTLSISKQPTLQPGEYQLVKTLKIDEAQLEAYWNSYLQTANCLYTADYFIQTQMAQIDITGCGLTCNTCEHKRDSILNASNNLTSDQKAQLSHICDTICNNNDITCLSALQAMKGDMSPDGQYGQIRPQNQSGVIQPAMPSTSIDPNNVPSTTNQSDITISQGQDTSNTNNTNGIDPSQFPVSIFNDHNNLRLDQVLQSATPYPSWRYPLQVSNTSIYNGPNFSNQILFSGVNLQQGALSYSVTDYTNPDGTVFYVNVIGFGKNTSNNNLPDSTSPKVTDLSKLILINEADSLYKIPARYLQNFADLDPYWQQDWANYLIPYHPEYQYFIQCTGQQQSNNFAYTLSHTSTVADAVSAGFLTTDGTPTILQADAFVNSNGGYLGYMKSRTSSYDTVTIAGITQNVSMAKMATIAVNCPRLQNNCGMPDCTNGIINTDDEWNTYKGYYLSERQTLLTDAVNKTAVNGLYYNGCIGHSDYLTSPDDYYFLQPVTTAIPFPFSYRDCFFCSTKTVTMFFHSTTYPYLNPGQVCYVGFSRYYKDKVQRFYPTISTSTPGSTPPKNCVITAPNDDATKPPVQIRVPCKTDIQTALNQAEQAAYSFKYTSCGECPIASDVEQLIMDLRSNSLLLTDTTTTPINLLVSCDQDAYPVHLGETLKNLEMPKTDPSNPLIYWTSAVSHTGNGNVLTGILYNGSSSIYDTIALWIPDSIPFSYNKLTQLCCLTVSTSSTTKFFPYKQNQVFTLQGSYPGKGVSQISFVAEGYTSFPLAPCSFAPSCQLSDDASNTVAFLNTLALNNSSIDQTKQQNLIAATAVNLADPGIKDYYNATVINLIRKNNVTLPGQFVDDISSLSPSWV